MWSRSYAKIFLTFHNFYAFVSVDDCNVFDYIFINKYKFFIYLESVLSRFNFSVIQVSREIYLLNLDRHSMLIGCSQVLMS